MTFPTLTFSPSLPQIILVVAALVVLIADLLIANKRVLGWFSLVAVLGALAVTLFVLPRASPDVPEHGAGRWPGAVRQRGRLDRGRAGDPACRSSAPTTSPGTPAPYYALMLLATAGMIVMAIANDFMMIFLGLEILSLALYILVGFNRKDAALGRGRAEVLPAGRIRQRLLPLRHRADLRRDRHDQSDRDRPGHPAAVGLPAVRAAAADRRRAAARRLRLQGGAGPLPHVDARRLPGRADAGDRVHVGGDQGRRVCRA